MPPSRAVHLFLVLLASVLIAGGCSAGGGAPPPAVPDARVDPRPAAIRTTVQFGPDDVVVAEIERIGADARAIVRMPTRLLGEEVLVGDDHYVRMPDFELVLGVDRWIHSDLSDPVQRRHHEANPAGFIGLEDLAHRTVGDEVAGHPVLGLRRPREGVVLLDLGAGRDIEVRTESVQGGDLEPISPPDPDLVVRLVDLPGLMDEGR